MPSSIVDRWIEEDYFTSICLVLDELGLDSNQVEDNAHRIMDAWTFNGVLDTESLDAIIDKMIGVDVSEDYVRENDYED